MTNLPPVPDTAKRAADEAGGPGWDYDSWAALDAAWPHLYAAALRHAADIANPKADRAGLWTDWLRRMADEANPHVEVHTSES